MSQPIRFSLESVLTDQESAQRDHREMRVVDMLVEEAGLRSMSVEPIAKVIEDEIGLS